VTDVVRVGGFVVTTGEPVVVIVLDTDTVTDPLTLFVAYGVVGTAHAVGVLVILIVPVLEPGALELTFWLSVTVRVVECVGVEEGLGDGSTLCVIVGGFEPDPVLQAHGTAVDDGSCVAVGDPVGLRCAVGLGEAAVEGDTVVLKLGMLTDAFGDAVADCVGLTDIDTVLLALNKGVKLPRGVPEPGPLAEIAGEELPALLKDPTEVIEAPGDPVSDWVELLDTDAELLADGKGVKVTPGVPEPGPLAEIAGEELPALLKDPTELRDP